MKYKKATCKTIGYMVACCACEKPKPYKKTLVITTVSSEAPECPTTYTEIKYYCKKCGFEIMKEK